MIIKFPNVQEHPQYLKKTPCIQRFKYNSKSKFGHNSVKIQFKVMGFGIRCHLITLNKCVKFRSNSTHSVWEKAFHAKVSSIFLLLKRGIIQSNFNSELLDLVYKVSYWKRVWSFKDRSQKIPLIKIFTHFTHYTIEAFVLNLAT